MSPISPIILVPKYHRIGHGFSSREQVRALEHTGRRSDGTQSAASWIADLLSLKKVLILCAYCRSKFNPRKHHYRRFYSPDPSGSTDGYVVNGKCDGCKQFTVNCGGGTGYVHEDQYRLTCIDPVEARRKARLKTRHGTSLWDAVQKLHRA